QVLADSSALALENAMIRDLFEHQSRGAASKLAAMNLKLEAANLELQALNRQLDDEVAERRRAEEEVRRAALTDELTGAANRRGFFVVGEERLEEARRAGLECAVIFVDIDGLKRITDTRGAEAGSAMIRDVASLLRATCPPEAVIGRLGGDEFAVFAAAPALDAERLEADIHAAVEALNAEPGRPVKLSLSVGGATLQPNAMTSLDELLAAADRAMYEHKPAAADERAGRHREAAPHRPPGLDRPRAGRDAGPGVARRGADGRRAELQDRRGAGPGRDPGRRDRGEERSAHRRPPAGGGGRPARGRA